MKNLIARVLRSLVTNESAFIKLKDAVFTNPAEHLFRVRSYACKNYADKLHLPIIDIGAANGGTADYFTKHFTKAPVIAYEPIKKMYEIASETNKNNKNVTVKNIGLYDSAGTKEINITLNYLSSSINELNSHSINEHSEVLNEKMKFLQKETISTSTLDLETQSLKEILLIKIDTQGTELTIFKSGKETLKKTHLVLVEMNNNAFYKNGCQYFEVDQFMRENGFALRDIIVAYHDEGHLAEYDAIYERIT